ncbi:MAG: valine--tRNA ligase [Phycisphaeraceae bacterium]|nr:valine--tRNA ligase [Phycisphaeraceae bacterium]
MTDHAPNPSSSTDPKPGAAAPSNELPKAYKPSEHEDAIRARWESTGAFHADPSRVLSGDAEPFAIVIPPPNVTAALHLGHALNNTLQDVLVRAHRMKGYETLWMPGTDHAGIATQSVVEKRVLKEEGKRRADFKGEEGRREFVGKIQAFKDEYERVITDQLKRMGCSCDWERQRFTMDEVCAAAVREAFFQLFKDGLIYRGKRLVNWDPVSQTALSDDEVEMEEVDGHFFYLRYPLVHRSENSEDAKDAQEVTWDELASRGYPGADGHDGDENAWVTVATTRPETYLGDTAVAINPRDPRAAALRGLCVQLPLVGRVIPIVEDDYVVMPAADPDAEGVDAKAKYATGFLKVTPAHDPNDYEIGRRHGLPVINVMAPDASISDLHGWTDIGDARGFVGLSREEARRKVVAAFKERGLLEAQKPYRHSVGHSYRSHAAIEPYLSDQWYVKVTDPRLAGAALDAMVHEQRGNREAQLDPVKRGAEREAGDASLRFYPERYAKTYETWHENIRDWCISRQLWWGHRIPIFYLHQRTAQSVDPGVVHSWEQRNLESEATLDVLGRAAARACGLEDDVWFQRDLVETTAPMSGPQGVQRTYFGVACSRSRRGDLFLGHIHRLARMSSSSTEDQRVTRETFVREYGNDSLRPSMALAHRISHVSQDPDVLDTWFSSALWPMSTMGWPDATAAANATGIADFPQMLDAFNPTSVLCTAREIITLWVSRMVMFNRYLRPEGTKARRHEGTKTEKHEGGKGSGPVPFRDVFIHSVIQDGEGRKMSKSLGNGVDPLDIIESHGSDAMRFTLVQMTTSTQDVRMPVERDPTTGKNTSPKFDQGRNFCNKLWNAARFAVSILEKAGADDASRSVKPSDLSLVDRWMLSRVATTVADVDAALGEYQYAPYATAMYDLLWRDFCDWYLEAIKPTVASSAPQRAVLRATLDAILRMLHPIAPYITEAIHERVRSLLPTAAIAGLDLTGDAKDAARRASAKWAGMLCREVWPRADASLRDERAEQSFERLRQLVTACREVRSQHQVSPKRRVKLHVDAELAKEIGASGGLVETLAGLGEVSTATPAAAAVTFSFDSKECFLSDLADQVDAGAERERLTKQITDLDKSITALEGRLGNPGYADRAPKHLVDQTRDQLMKAKADREAARANLARLS